MQGGKDRLCHKYVLLMHNFCLLIFLLYVSPVQKNHIVKEKEDKVALKAFNEDEEDFEEIGVPVEELVDVHDLSRFNDVAKV